MICQKTLTLNLWEKTAFAPLAWPDRSQVLMSGGFFLNSVKVNGEKSNPGKPFGFDDARKAFDHYGKSKAKAELGLLKTLAETNLQVNIIRPQLLYGPNISKYGVIVLNIKT
jgi:hypothetical protein